MRICEQSRVLDCNDGLIGKGSDKFDLAVRKRLDPFARKANGADHYSIAEKRDTQSGSHFAECNRLRNIELGVSKDVSDMENAGFQRGPACEGAAPERSKAQALHPCRIFWRKPKLRDEPSETTFGLEDESHVCTAQL